MKLNGRWNNECNVINVSKFVFYLLNLDKMLLLLK